MAHELVLVCQACGLPVVQDDGYLWADTARVAAVERARRLRREQRAGSYGDRLDDLLAGPEPAVWQAHHQQCDDRREEMHYRLAAAQLRTRADLLDWSAHLVGKGWVLAATDWCEVMREARDGGSRLAVVSR